MKKVAFQSAKFLGSMLSETLSDRHGNPLPEIALVGRSNVGKSSLINHLLHQKRLAYVSSKPGKTTTLNFYNIDDALILVDLPGYGYAARSMDQQTEWSQSIDTYLNKRKTLKLILLLIDSRREVSSEDLQVAEWASYHQKPLLLIFTKSDTLKPCEKQSVSKKILDSFPSVPFLYYSIKDGKSRSLLISKINYLLSGKLA